MSKKKNNQHKQMPRTRAEQNGAHAAPLQVSGEITDITAEGMGVLKHEGIVYFTDGGVIGDTVTAEVTKLKKNFGEARIVAITDASPFRTSVDCTAFEGMNDIEARRVCGVLSRPGFENSHLRCGGCDFRNFLYSSQLEWKKHVVTSALTKIGGIENPPLDRIVGAEERFSYRNNIQFPVRLISGKPRIGFFARRSNDLVVFETCRLIPPKINELVRELESFLEAKNIPVKPAAGTQNKSARGEALDHGVLKHIGVRISPKEELILIFVTTRQSWNFELPEELLTRYRIVSVYENVNPSDYQTYGRDWIHLWGADSWEESLLGKRFQLFPASFFQVHREQTESLYQIAIFYAFGDSDANKSFL
ncbi:MAG: hypothetical protein Q4A41_04660, partial [Bacillota bacterium]|nr:hypothetical protein [Bacillota bacterium]